MRKFTGEASKIYAHTKGWRRAQLAREPQSVGQQRGHRHDVSHFAGAGYAPLRIEVSGSHVAPECERGITFGVGSVEQAARTVWRHDGFA
jgi:hypothetical protein